MSIRHALESYVSLNEVINDLTADEVAAALELEAATLRRRAIIERLICRAVRLNEIQYAEALRRKYA